MSKKRNLKRVSKIKKQREEEKRAKQLRSQPQPAKKRKTKVDYRQDKINWLISQGYDNPLSLFTVNQIDSIKIADIRKGTLTADGVPFLKALYTEFDKEKRLGKDEHFFFAYRSFSGNTSLDFILSYQMRKSNKNLLDSAVHLMLLNTTYDGDEGTSSGKDGSIRYEMASINNMRMNAALLKSFNNMSNKSKSRRRHSDGEFLGWQILKQGKNPYLSRASFRDMLIIFNAFAENCVELERLDFSEWFLTVIEMVWPQFLHYFPSSDELNNVFRRSHKVPAKKRKKKK